ncbi:uncharacterized protein LOC121179666 [Toxotes jaculatrix]|uniref:uncharacterized protein LOC121179666 n=1 Tax=Toxotes jaculatrix TaxID=941984 RepID=UPI001B3AACB2|nr:uncharacterized protein LOC121179666 [Toxotes jaculatrix]
MMEAGAVLLLLFALQGTASALSFYGDSITFMPPQKRTDGTFRVTFHHRQNGRSSCKDQSSFTCESGVCTSFNELSVLQTEQDNTGQGRWCQSEGHTTATVSTNGTSFSLRGSGCCWVSNVNGKTNWTTRAELDLGTRSDSYALDSCPVTTTVSSLRVPQNCFSRIRLLAHDPDGDKVRCRFSSDALVPSNFTLDETECALTSTGQVDVGVQVFELMLEDFSTKNITLTYADGTSAFREASDMNAPPLCKVKLQFSVEILPPIPSCEIGHVLPMFLSKTPSHGEVLHATVGQTFQLYAQAQAHHASINDFQVSGPQNMSKVFRDDTNGKAEVTVSWTPQHSDLYRFVPVCFTAETKATQSEMRCVVVMVTQASVTQGKATVECSPNKMKVALDKASMPDIDVNYLKLSDPSCSLTSNNTHIMGSMSFSTCGTKVEDKGDFIAFKNEINSFELPSEIITRRRTVKIGFSCQFPKTISISSFYSLHQSDYIFTESSFGSFGYTFEIFNDGNFTSKVEPSAYPVEVKLLQKIFMGIQAQSELPSVNLFVESCKATPDNNPENSLSYDLIKNGCLEDETLKVHPSNQSSFNFEVQAFKFTGNYDQVYITCSVILCEPGSPFSRCAQGCLKNPSRRRRRGLSRETVSHYITQGPLQFVGQAVPSAEVDGNDVMKKSDKPSAVSPPPVSSDTKSSGGGWDIKHILNTNISTMVFATAFLVSVVLMAVVVRYFSKKRKEDDRNALIVSAWET